MGTRSLTHIYACAEDKTPLVTIYRQFDGYPEGHGQEIREILGGRQLVNGYNDKSKQCNGMGCAAALLIGALKGGNCGGIYIESCGASDCGEEFTYRLFPCGETFRLVIDGIYDGELSDFDPEKLTTAR